MIYKYVFNLTRSNVSINVDLMFKLLAIVVLFNPYLYKSYLKIPFLDFLNQIKDPTLILWLTTLLTVIGACLMLLNIASKTGSMLIAISVFITIISCRPCYSDSRMYIFSLLFLLALYQKDYGIKILQWQVIILYFGSGINKLLDLDWQSGLYIENWLVNKLDVSTYKDLAALLPSMVFGKILSWSVIILEISIALCFTKKYYFKLGIWLSVLLHASSIIITNSIFGAFIVGVFISYLAFLDWPDKIVLSIPASRISRYLIKLNSFFDPYKKIKINIDSMTPRIKIDLNDKTYSNFRAIQKLILYHPGFYFFIVVIMVFPGFGHHWIKGVFLFTITALMTPIVGEKINQFIFNSKNRN